MFKDIKLVIYDLDGVLIDSSEGIRKTFEKSLKELETNYNGTDIKEMIGLPLEDIYFEVFKEDEDMVKRGAEIFRREYATLSLENTVIINGVTETLGSFKEADIMQSVATNKASYLATNLLVHLGIAEYFEIIIGALDVPNPKPAPDMINLTLEKLSVDREEAVFVDDTVTGLTAGIEAGVRTVGITTGPHSREMLEIVDSDIIIDSLTELSSII